MSTGSDTRQSALDEVLDGVRVDENTSAELFSVADALDSSVSLRRALTDPSTSEAGRRSLVHGLFDGRVSDDVVNVVSEAAAQRWSGGRAFADAIERQGVRAQLIASDNQGQIEETEDELFRFARLVAANPDLRNALSDRAVSLAGREELVAGLLEGKATSATVVLARRAVRARERSFGHTIESYVTAAATQKQRVIATVRVARPLSQEQTDRLREALRRQTGRDVAIQVIVEEGLLGGVRVELGSEVIEGTVAGRLDEARRLFS